MACADAPENGALNCTTASRTVRVDTTLSIREAHSSRLPKVINIENGSRNFTDALSHSQ
jgi:hypothetical protein